ncbi:hypothetical protein AAC387_Pa03g3929 [Persea americana]
MFKEHADFMPPVHSPCEKEGVVTYGGRLAGLKGEVNRKRGHKEVSDIYGMTHLIPIRMTKFPRIIASIQVHEKDRCVAEESPPRTWPMSDEWD